MLKGLATIKRFFPALLPRASGPHINQILLINASSLNKCFSSPDGSCPPPYNPDSTFTTNFKWNAPQLGRPLGSSLCFAFRNLFSTEKSSSKKTPAKNTPPDLTL